MGRGVWSCAGMLAAALTCAGVTASVAQTAGPAAEQVAAWTDAHVARRVAAGEAPGAVVAVVYNGAVILQKGYGFADGARTVPMDPERTRVRVGAVSHLATAATALAAAEAGTVRLQQDIHPLWERNGFSIPSPSTLTLTDLLTHSAGYADRLLGQFVAGESQLQPLREYLMAAMPPLVLQAGQAVLPSVHGLAVAGLTLEFAAGQPFPELAQRVLLTPAGMTNSTFDPKPPAAIRSTIASGHHWGATLEPVPLDFPSLPPASGLITTAADIAKLLQVVTNGGSKPDGTRLWSEEANGQLLMRRATNHPSMPGRSLALEQTPLGARTVWTQTGLVRGYTAQVSVVPELGLAVFIAANGGAYEGLQQLSRTGVLVHDLATEMVGALWPETSAPTVPVRNIAPDDRADYAGQYRVAAIDKDTPLKAIRLLQSVRVDAESDVRIVIEGKQFQKIGLDLFQSGPEFVRFLRSGEGDVTYLLRGHEVWERAPVFETDTVQRAFIGIAVGLLALGALVSLAGLIVGWKRRLANAIGLVGALGGLALVGWVAWQLTHLTLGLAMAQGMAGVPFGLLLWTVPAGAAAFSFFYALFGIGIPNFNRATLIGTTLGWVLLYPVLTTWNLLA